jgi:hypothetical protein
VQPRKTDRSTFPSYGGGWLLSVKGDLEVYTQSEVELLVVVAARGRPAMVLFSTSHRYSTGSPGSGLMGIFFVGAVLP